MDLMNTAANVTAFPDLFAKMQFDLSLLDRQPRALDLIDDHLIPRGTTTIIATDAGSGKSTSAIRSSASAAATGLWTMLGTKAHDRALRCAVILGEDNDRTFEGVLAGLPPDTLRHIRAGIASQTLLLSPFRAFAKTQQQGDLFGVDGKVTDLGDEIFRAMRQFRPDVLILDTTTSLSECAYLSRKEAYNTMNALNDLAEDCDAAVILMMHLTKTGSEKLTVESTAEDLIRGVSGSAGLIAATRHALAFARCPKGKFENIQLGDEGDERWMCGVKTNSVKGAASKLFPVIRDAREMVLRTTSYDGVPLLEQDNRGESAVMEYLRAELPFVIQAAAELRSPFAQKASSKISVEQLSVGALAGVIPVASPTQLTKALSELERVRAIVPCTPTRSGGSVVWDVPEGMFARQAEFETVSGDKLEFRKGAPSAQELREKIQEIQRRSRPVDVLDEARAIAEAREAEERAEKEEKETRKAMSDADRRAEAEQKRRQAEAAAEAKRQQSEAQKLRAEAEKSAEADRAAAADAALARQIEPRVESIVRSAAILLRPFAASGALSPAGLVALVSPAFPAGVEKRHIEAAADALLRAGRITVARQSATGGAVLDVPGGPFATPDDHLDGEGNAPKFKSGAPDLRELMDLMDGV
jgi:hypothetical protein